MGVISASGTSFGSQLHVAGYDQTIQLPDGRKLGLRHSGDLNGKPLFFFPGFGVSRLAAHPDPTIAQSLGVHIVAVDRPGIGLSDRQPRRTLLDWPDDVLALADALGMAHFAVFGWSAGGPHALACAYKIPARLTAVGIASSAPPFSDRAAIRTMPASVKQLALAARIVPWGVRLSFWRQCWQIRQNSRHFWSKSLAELAAPDRAVATDPRFESTLLESMVTACSYRGQGLADDVLVIAHAWGFRPEQVALPVHLWHGEADRTIPRQVGQYFAATIPDCQAVFLPEEGHFAYLTHWPDILSTLMQ